MSKAMIDGIEHTNVKAGERLDCLSQGVHHSADRVRVSYGSVVTLRKCGYHAMSNTSATLTRTR